MKLLQFYLFGKKSTMPSFQQREVNITSTADYELLAGDAENE